ncbi:MAG: CsgG/HfaB family protein [Spirochaetota bacterium]
MRAGLLLLSFLVCCTVGFAADAAKKPVVKKVRVGVLDFKANSVAAMETTLVNDIFRNELVDSGKYDVLDRKNMQSIMSEQEFQQTGCTDSECAVKLGKMLNMEYMINGVLAKTSGKYFLSVEMISVESSKIEKTARVQFESMDKLEKAIVELVEGLTGEKKPEDISSYSFYIEGIYAGFLITYGRMSYSVPTELPYETGMGGDIFLRGRLFGKKNDVLKLTWMIGCEAYITSINTNNGGAERSPGLSAASAIWINPYICPLVGVTLKLGPVNTIIAGQAGYLFLMERATLNGIEYTQMFSMMTLGGVITFDIKLFDVVGIFLKNEFTYHVFLGTGGYIDTGSINYNSFKGSSTLGIMF